MNRLPCAGSASGISKPKHLRSASVVRLKLLALVEEREGRICLTPLGATRCGTDSRPSASSSGD